MDLILDINYSKSLVLIEMSNILINSWFFSFLIDIGLCSHIPTENIIINYYLKSN